MRFYKATRPLPVNHQLNLARGKKLLLSRRNFCVLIGGTIASAKALPLRAESLAEESQLRAIAYNIFKCTGWPKKRPLAQQAVAQGQIGQLIGQELALYRPNLVTLSEATDEKVVKEIAEVLGMQYVIFPSGQRWPGALLTKFEIVASQNVPLAAHQETTPHLFTRHWGSAELRLKNGETLVVHSVHLHPQDPSTRQKEIDVINRSLESDRQAGRSMLLMGDLNHAPDDPEHQQLITAAWTDTFEKVGQGDGFTVHPDRRIDYILATGPITNHVEESKALSSGFFQIDPADSKSFALSDHLPQMAVFSGS